MRKNKIFALIIAVVILSLVLGVIGCTGCNPENPDPQEPSGNPSGNPSGTPSGTPNAPSEPIKYPSVILDRTKINLVAGQSKTLNAKVTEQNATVTWLSDNESVCTVENGVVYAHSAGEAVVSVTFGEESAFCKVTVYKVGYELVTDKESYVVKPGDEIEGWAKLTLDGESIQSTFTYKSEDKFVAEVDSVTGTIVAKNIGETVVSASVTIDEQEYTASVKIKVTDNYTIKIEPYTTSFEVDEEREIAFSVFKAGTVVSYPLDEMELTSSDTAIAEVYIEEGRVKVKAKSLGIATVTLTLSDSGASSRCEIIVVDSASVVPTLELSDFKVYTGASTVVPVKGFEADELIYFVSDTDFVITDGVIFAPSEAKSCTIIAMHKPSGQKVSATVNAVEFNPSITTARQFMDLYMVHGGIEVTIDADIDLTEEAWSERAGIDTRNPNRVIAYLVEELDVRIDGRGHTVFVEYGHDCSDTAQIGGLFGSISGNGAVQGLVIRYKAEYTGAASVDGPSEYGLPGTHPQAGMKQCIITYNNYGTIRNNYVEAEFYSDGFTQREAMIGFTPANTISDNVFNAVVYSNMTAKDAGKICAETPKGLVLPNNIVINEGRATDATSLVFNMYEDLADAWASSEDESFLAAKTAYTQNEAWDIAEKTISHYGNVVYTCPVRGPRDLVALGDGKVKWSEADGIDCYKLRIKWSGDSAYTELADTTEIGWDVTAYLKSLSETELQSRDGEYLSFEVASSTGGIISQYSALGNVLCGGLLRVADSAEDIALYNGTSESASYTVLISDIDIGALTFDDLQKSENGQYSWIITEMFYGNLNALGHKISYTYDNAPVTYTGANSATYPVEFCGLFYRTSDNTKIMNLRLEVSGTGELNSVGGIDAWYCMLAYQVQANVYNSYFNLRYSCTDMGKSEKSRTALCLKLAGASSSAELSAVFDNCIFDMVTYDMNGNMREAGAGEADTVLFWSTAGTTTHIKFRNCSYIANTATDSRHMPAESYLENTAMYESAEAFVTAWNENTLSEKSSYVDGGWDVAEDEIKLLGYTVTRDYTPVTPPPAPVLTLNLDEVEWAALEGAESYALKIKWESDSDWTALDAITDNCWSVTDYLKSMTKDELLAKHGKHLTLAVAGVNGSMTSPYAEIKVFGTENNGNSNYRLWVATDYDTFKTYMENGIDFCYVVLTEDLVLGDITPDTAISTASNTAWSITGISPSRSCINALGRKISYTYDDTTVGAPTQGSTIGGLFTSYSNGSYNLRVMNLALDATITTSRTSDDLHIGLFAGSAQAKFKGCYFKMRAVMPSYTVSGSLRSRTGVIAKTIAGDSSGRLATVFDSCVFDLLTTDANGAVLGGGGAGFRSDYVAMSQSGTARTNAIKDCVFVMNQEQESRLWLGYDSSSDTGLTVTDSVFVKDYEAFITAWNGELSAKDGLSEAGWSVDGDAVKYNGVQVNA